VGEFYRSRQLKVEHLRSILLLLIGLHIAAVGIFLGECVAARASERAQALRRRRKKPTVVVLKDTISTGH